MCVCVCVCTGAQVCIIVFSTMDRESFLAIEKWKNKVTQYHYCIIHVIIGVTLCMMYGVG